MKLVRSVAYAVIVICALLCIVIAIYASKKPSGEEGEPGEIHVISHGSETEEPSESPESGATVPNIADLIIDRAQSAGSSSSKVSISGNNTGEISYDEIVKRQNEDLDREFRTIISDYNKKYGIEVKTPTSTTATVSKDYKYFVNKNTKVKEI